MLPCFASFLFTFPSLLLGFWDGQRFALDLWEWDVSMETKTWNFAEWDFSHFRVSISIFTMTSLMEGLVAGDEPKLAKLAK
jgi:hypothetical protein